VKTFVDRSDAGQRLAEALASYADRDDVILLALPRGGVPVAAEVARQLRTSLDVFLVRKLGTPGREELAMGAIAPGGYRVMNRDVVAMSRVSEEEIAKQEEKERAELNRRLESYRGDRPPPDLSGKTVVLIDDGLATGASMQVAVEAVRNAGAARVVVAVPTAPPEAVERLEEVADEVISLITPRQFMAVGTWYESFEQTSDQEVRDLLSEAWSR
jgi:putative phosphoribosyl transferase